MKTKILTLLTLISFISLNLKAEGFDRKSAEAGVIAGMFVQSKKEEILSWSRLIAYKTLEDQARKYDCKNEVKASKNGASELIRGVCTFVNEKSKQDVYEGLNALSYAVLNTYEEKKEEALCAASLAFFTSRNYKVASILADKSKKLGSKSYLCKTAQNIVPLGLKYTIKYDGILESKNVCVE